MTNELDTRAEEIFLEVVELTPTDRSRRIAELAPDAALRERVEAFLSWDAEAPARFLDGDDEVAVVEPGERIGPYRVIQRLGEGGMGTVFAVRQSFPRREVALKLMRAGRMTRETLRRFRNEIDVLGRLQHVGIARIYDAGVFEEPNAVSAGRQVPYFTMELVRGVPLVRYASDRGLDVRSRVELLARVADAVHYAHVHGVVHRDLKSENVLVTIEESTSGGADAHLAAVGQPKILDFGIARAIERDEAHRETVEGALLGTLSAMSPEQVSGRQEDVDVRSDVYALGVMLYELLAERPPLRLEGLTVPQAARRIAEEEPTPLGSVVPSLRGDLTVVTTRALEKDPTRRYPSAFDLAADLRRFLRGEPIEARADSRLYVLRRSLRRHRLAVMATSIIASLTVAFGVSSWLQAERNASLAASEAQAARRSEEDFGRALAAIELLTTVAVEDLGEVPRAAEARRKLLQAALDFHGDLMGSHGGTEELRARSAATSVQLGHILDDLGQEQAAREQLDQAARALQHLDSSDAHVEVVRASTLARLAHTTLQTGDLAEAEQQALEALDILSAASHATVGSAEGQRCRVVSYTARVLASIHAVAGRHEEAIRAVRDALGPLERAVEDDPSSANLGELVRLLHRLTQAQLEAGVDGDIEARFEQASTVAELLVEENPDSPVHLSDLVGLLTNRGHYYGSVGRDAAMREDFERAVELGERLVTDHPAIVNRLQAFVMACNNLASTKSLDGNHEEAADLLYRARDLQEEILRKAPSSTRAGELGYVENNLGAILAYLQRYDEACEALEASLVHLDEALLDFPDRSDFAIARSKARKALDAAAADREARLGE